VKTPAKNLPELKRHLRKLPPPSSLFSGARIEQSFAPDNIIFFQRTDTAALKPEGVSANYHHRFELVSVIERPAPLRVDRASYLLHPGEAALIFPNQFHHFMDTTRGEARVALHHLRVSPSSADPHLARRSADLR
jgi:hypothetical protein